MHEQLAGCPIDTIKCMGGGARISLWQQIKADVTGCAVRVGQVNEATPMGAAMLCASALYGEPLEKIAREMQPEYKTFEPDPQRTRQYEEYFRIYLLSCEALEETNHLLDRR